MFQCEKCAPQCTKTLECSVNCCCDCATPMNGFDVETSFGLFTIYNYYVCGKATAQKPNVLAWLPAYPPQFASGKEVILLGTGEFVPYADALRFPKGGCFGPGGLSTAAPVQQEMVTGTFSTRK